MIFKHLEKGEASFVPTILTLEKVKALLPSQQRDRQLPGGESLQLGRQEGVSMGEE